MYKAVLFDLDGTFADTAPDLGAALNYVRFLHQLPALPLEIIRPHASHGSAGLLKAGFGIDPDSPQFSALRAEFLAYYDTHICEHTVLFFGMAELLGELEQRGVSWGIVTNKPHRFTVPLMQALGYAERAACMVSGDTCAQAKPHPQPLLHAAQCMGIAPQDCIYLGDDLRDMQAAQAAGMPGIIASYGYISSPEEISGWPAQACIDYPPQLLRYVDNLET
ncbi:MAG: HAD-IA family hydrolase [Gallionellaceae bacterium]